jgi:hypothetical protein
VGHTQVSFGRSTELNLNVLVVIHLHEMGIAEGEGFRESENACVEVLCLSKVGDAEGYVANARDGQVLGDCDRREEHKC